MSAKHTPGPWTVYDPEMPDTEATYGIDGPSGQPVVYFGLTQNDGINRLEDARLIAAAPELLLVTQGFRRKLATYVGVCPGDKELRRLLNECDAAIAKAIG